MAVILYRGVDEVVRIDPNSLQQHLQAGWQLERGHIVKEEIELVSHPDPEATGIAIEKPSFEEADTNNSGKLSVDEIREAAKAAGIEGWDRKKMKTLKRELGYEED